MGVRVRVITRGATGAVHTVMAVVPMTSKALPEGPGGEGVAAMDCYPKTVPPGCVLPFLRQSHFWF